MNTKRPAGIAPSRPPKHRSQPPFPRVPWELGGLCLAGQLCRSRRTEGGRHHRRGRREQRDEHRGGIEPALVRGAEHAGEDLLAGGAACGAIATATRFPGHDGGPERLLRAPIGGVERRVEEEAEEGRKVIVEMLLELRDAPVATGAARQQAAESLEVLPPGHGEAMRRHGAGVIRIARGECGLQEGLDRGDPRVARIVEQQDATAPE